MGQLILSPRLLIKHFRKSEVDGHVLSRRSSSLVGCLTLFSNPHRPNRPMRRMPWADPIAAPVIAGIAIKEGRDAWRGHTYCTPPHQKGAEGQQPVDDYCASIPETNVASEDNNECACCEPDSGGSNFRGGRVRD